MSQSNKIAVVNGEISPTLDAFADAEFSSEIIILDLDGVPEDLTDGTVELEVHSGKNRTDTPEATYAAALTAATAGHATLTVVSASFTLGVGTHYAYVKYTESGGEVHYGLGQIQLNVK